MHYDSTPEPGAPSSRRVAWAVGAALIMIGIGGLAAWGATRPDALSYFMTPSDVAAKGAAAQGPSLRVGGRVEPGTLVRDGSSVRFSVSDGTNAVPVAYTGEVPDTLKESTDVVAEGAIAADGILRATRVLAKCSSRFVPKVERDARASATG